MSGKANANEQSTAGDPDRSVTDFFEPKSHKRHKSVNEATASSEQHAKKSSETNSEDKPSRIVQFPAKLLYDLFIRKLTDAQWDELTALVKSYPDHLGPVTGQDVFVTEEDAAILSRLAAESEAAGAPLGEYQPWREAHRERWHRFGEATGKRVCLEKFALMYVFSRPVFNAWGGAHAGVKQRDACNEGIARTKAREAYRLARKNGDTAALHD